MFRLSSVSCYWTASGLLGVFDVCHTLAMYMCVLSCTDLAVLNALIQPFKDHARERGKANLSGYCQPVTAAAEHFLNERKFLGQSWQAVEGTFRGNDGEKTGHAWLQTTATPCIYILDLTADQFGLVAPIYVTHPYPQYSTPADDVGRGVRDSARCWFEVVSKSLADHIENS